MFWDAIGDAPAIFPTVFFYTDTDLLFYSIQVLSILWVGTRLANCFAPRTPLRSILFESVFLMEWGFVPVSWL
jgi:hypothetical protein